MEMVAAGDGSQHGLPVLADREAVRLADHIHRKLVGAALRMPVQFHPRQEHRGHTAAMAVLPKPPGTGTAQVRRFRQPVFVSREHLAQRVLRVERSVPSGMCGAEVGEFVIDGLHPGEFVFREVMVQQWNVRFVGHLHFLLACCDTVSCHGHALPVTAMLSP